MKINQSFKVARPREIVWALFEDVPEVAKCMPGAELTEAKGDGRYAGRVGMKLGPFNATFEGEAHVMPDAASHSGRVEGKGVDKRGGSRSKLLLDYRFSALAPGETQVDIDADVQLSGPVAQFGRTGIITETANILIEQFVRNVEARLAAMPAAPVLEDEGIAPGAAAQLSPPSAAKAEPSPARPPPAPISAIGLVRKLIAAFVRRLFGGKGAQP